jgi:methyltransferase (TIGR00027 family)
MPPIRNVSDTAYWVAMYRASESARPDALFHDDWAERLAGERGRAILAAMPQGRRWAWPMVVRTAVMDEIILREVAAGADTVVMLAAGLDMRPFRLALPATLRWVEVDLPAILAEKAAVIGNAVPNCALERIAADLADPAARRDALARATAGARRTLVVAEGLLIYLNEAQVAALADDLAALPSAALWLIDLAHPKLREWMTRQWGSAVERAEATFQFAPEAGTAFFEPHGWREREFRGALQEAERLHRTMPNAWLYKLLGIFMPSGMREQYRRFSGYVLLERTAARSAAGGPA